MTGAGWQGAGWQGEVAAACHACRDLAPRAVPAGDVFQSTLDQELRGLVGRATAEQLGAALAEGHRGVLAARRGELDRADGHLRACSRELEQVRANGLAAAAGQAVFLNQQAFLRHAGGEDDQAEAVLRRAFVLDAGLVGAGLTVMGMHQVQLLTNLVRLRFRRDRIGEATALASFLLLFLETGSDRHFEALPHPWRDHWAAPAHAARDGLDGVMHAQLARILALRAEDARCPADARGWLDPLRRELERAPAGQALAWCGFQCCAAEGRREQALLAACRVLRQGPEPSEPFWLSAMLWVRKALDDLLPDPAAVAAAPRH